jgi:hypothetical protein
MTDNSDTPTFKYKTKCTQVDKHSDRVFSNVEDIITLLGENKITSNQAKGMCLEVCTFIALENIGIYPVPDHNPFNEKYAKDKHLGIDMRFFYENMIFGVECKNISPDSNISGDWVEREVVNRFSKLEDIMEVDVRIVLTSVQGEIIAKMLTREYEVLEVGFQMYPENMVQGISNIESLFKGLFERLKHSEKSDHLLSKRYLEGIRGEVEIE